LTLPTAYCLLFEILTLRAIESLKPPCREIRRYANLHVASRLEWRNWQTQQTQNGKYSILHHSAPKRKTSQIASIHAGSVNFSLCTVAHQSAPIPNPN
jgi:hypothetical protein